jgi:hypothetical protein
MFVIFGFSTIPFNNVMSNTATSTIFIPLSIYMMRHKAAEVAVIIGLCSVYGFVVARFNASMQLLIVLV